MKKLTSAVIAIVAAGSIILSGTSYAAGSAAFSLSPASGTEDVNSSFSVGIYENGSAVNVVTANFSYDTAKLQLVSVDTSASAFASDAGSTTTSISRYVPAGATVSGSQEVAVLNFKAIAGSGSAAVTVGTSGSHIASNGAEQWSGAAANGSYVMNTPVATNPGNGSGSTGGTTTGSTGSTGTTTATGTSGNTGSTTKPGTATTSTGTTTTGQVQGTTTTTPSTGTTSKTSPKTPAKKVTAPAPTNNHVIVWTTGGIVVLGFAAAVTYLKFFRR